MKTLLQINSGIVGSTGSIMRNISKQAEKAGFISYTASAKDYSQLSNCNINHIYIGGIIEKRIHRILGEFTGNEGGYSRLATFRFLRKVDKLKPDIIHLHNLHLNYINLKMLFQYLKENENIKVVWTLHDCWSFTGHCPHYEMVGCEKWKTQCFECPIYTSYPVSRIDNSRVMFNNKKTWFNGVKNLTLVTPSRWIYNQVSRSFLKNYERAIIYNGINLDVFKPRNSDFKKIYNLNGYKIVLGVAFSWSKAKGLDIFYELADKLDESYRIVMVGLSEENMKEIKDKRIIGLKRTSSPKELAEIYTAANVFVNATRQEMFGLTNIEALACGTPVITFDSGGSSECINEETGFVVKKDNLDELVNKIHCICEGNSGIEFDKCIERAAQFNASEKFNEYVTLYKRILNVE